MLTASRMTPGIASGATLPKLNAPALPKEQPRPGSSRSISVTRAPRRRSCQAAQTPTMPAPITTTVSRPFPVISIGRARGLSPSSGDVQRHCFGDSNSVHPCGENATGVFAAYRDFPAQ